MRLYVLHRSVQACVLTSCSSISVSVDLLLVHKFHLLMALCPDLIDGDIML